MLPDRRAVIFDLDDTLYPYRRFVLSGFIAVATHLARTCKVNRGRAIRLLHRASRTSEAGSELETCLEQLGLRQGLLPSLVAVLRNHQPTLQLPRAALVTLNRLRAEGWRLGVLTNGPRSVQARKVAALGIARWVDTVVYATEFGTGAGKPDPEPFAEVLRRLKVPPSHAVFVGNDEICDIEGAQAAGLLAVFCTAWTLAVGQTSASATVRRLPEIPLRVRALLEEALTRHVA